MARQWLRLTCAILFLAVWTWAAIGPTFRDDWWLENILVFLFVPVFVLIELKWGMSDASLSLLTAFMLLHVIGSHWTYSNVPLPLKAWGMTRNPYDRWVHTAFGLLLTYPMAELVVRRGWAGRGAAILVCVQFVFAASALYEIMEWVTGVVVAGDAAQAFLGSQGDSFDAVKDMAVAGAGAVVAGLACIPWWRRERRVQGVRAAIQPAP